MKKLEKGRVVLWTVGGLALGLIIAFVLGILVFWAWPAYRKAKSPLGEIEVKGVVMRYLKDSPVANKAAELAAKIGKDWLEVLDILGVPEEKLPSRVYVYVYHTPKELLTAFSARIQGEATPLAVVDLLAERPARGALARLGCSLAYGKPGNVLFPRGLAIYLDEPRTPWAAEAAAYGVANEWRLLFQHAERLLPREPWEDLYFQVDAPWTSATPTMETLASLFSATSDVRQETPAWEALTAAFAQFVLENFGPQGVKSLWLARGWDEGARALGLSPQEFSRRWEDFLAEGIAQAKVDALLAAKSALYSGRPSEALNRLQGLNGRDAAYLKGMAHLALGEPEAALSYLKGSVFEEPLRALISTPPLSHGRIQVVGVTEDEEIRSILSQATDAMARALEFWAMEEDKLPERLTIYLGTPPSGTRLPWGVIWANVGTEELSELVVRFVLELVSPLGLPRFDAMVRGLVLQLAYPNRDFISEARTLLKRGHWVSLTQPLSDYPPQIVEAEAGAFVAFLLGTYGKEKVQEFWHLLSMGASPYRASQETFGLDLPALDKAVQTWLTLP